MLQMSKVSDDHKKTMKIATSLLIVFGPETISIPSFLNKKIPTSDY